MEEFETKSTTDAGIVKETTNYRNQAKSEDSDTRGERTEIDCNHIMLAAESQYSMHTRAVEEQHCNSTVVRPVPEAFYSPNLATSGEQNALENSDYLGAVAEILHRQSWYVLEHRTRFAQDQSATEKDEGDFMDLNGESYQNTCALPERHDPWYSPCTFVAPQAHCSIITSSTKGVAKQIESEPVESDTVVTEAHRLFLADLLLEGNTRLDWHENQTYTIFLKRAESADPQDYNLNDIFDSLKSTFSPVAPPVQNKIPELEGRSVPGDHVNALLPKPPILNQPSGFGSWAGKRKVTEALGEVTESRVFRRNYLVTEHSEEADLRVSLTNTVPSSETGEIDIKRTPRGNEIDEDEFEQPQDVQYEQQKNSEDVGDPYAFAGNYEDLYEPGDEVLPKTMGWFPVEYPNVDIDTNLSVRWILDEPPSASDLPHLESLLEISPSRFWSPESESRKPPPVRFGYLCCSESSQSSHSIQYFLNDSPASSPEVTRTMLHGAPSVRISSKEPNHRCSQACPEFHGIVQNILTPVSMGSESMEASMDSPSLGSSRKLAAQVQEGVPEMSPAFSEDNPKKNTSREQNTTSPVHQDHTHYQETGCVANLTASESAARRLQISQRGKNLATDFLKVGTTTQENIEARLIRNDIQHKDTTVQPSSTLWAQVENTIVSSDEMRLQCSTGLSTKERESSLPSLELQTLHEGDGNCLTKRDSPLLRPLSSPLKLQDRLQGDRNCTRKRDAPLVPLSVVSNHPNLSTRLRNALHEKLESQLLFPKPVSESPSNERLVTVQCPEVASDNIAWSTMGVPRVSRKRSSRITTPKRTRVEVFNMFGNGKVAQPVRTTPNKDYYTCKRKKRTPKRSTVEELSTVPRNFKLRHLASTLTSDCETDLRKMPMQEGIRPAKPPTLTRIVKPLRLIKTSPAEGYTCVRIKPTLKSRMGKGLPTDSRSVNPLQFVKNSPVKHLADVSKAVLTPGKNPGVSGEATQKHEVKEESLSKLPADCEISKIPALRSSKYRGVTRHRHTGRYEAHLWDNSKIKLGLAKRGRQVYLGAYPDEDQAAQAHDLAALKYWGPGVYTNFPPSLYEEELKTMENLTKEEYVIILRRRSPGFTRGISKYRGVTRHHQEGRWEARIGRHSGAKYHYLGTYDTQEEAAAAYDRAAVRHRGAKAITNFDISNYIKKII